MPGRPPDTDLVDDRGEPDEQAPFTTGDAGRLLTRRRFLSGTLAAAAGAMTACTATGDPAPTTGPTAAAASVPDRNR
ncbi:hypothetical protein KR546_16685, partial [Nitriliruptoria bacterium AS10]